MPPSESDPAPYNPATGPVNDAGTETHAAPTGDVGLGRFEPSGARAAFTVPRVAGDRNLHPDLPADLRTPLRGWDLVSLAVFYLVAGLVILFVVGLASMYFFRVPLQALQNFSPAQATVAIVGQTLLSAALVALLYLMVRSRSAADFWPSVGWRAFRESDYAGIVGLCCTAGFLLAIGVGFASGLVDRGKVLPMEELFRDRTSILLLTGLGLFVAPLVEETIFRGCVYPVLARSWGVTASVIVTGILFGMAHAQQLWPGYGQIVLIALVGMVLTYVRARTGTVVASFCVHFSYNATQFAFLYLATGFLRHLQP